MRGSSPLARGTLPVRWPKLTVDGLIPARAGNTPRLQAALEAIRAHPRSRGEHHQVGPATVAALGSSPLARGTPHRERHHLGHGGLIPARAGNTHFRFNAGNHPRAHPRSRGEHPPALRPSCSAMGSSPLARGTPAAGERGDTTSGLIPARAGNTVIHCTTHRARRAHPRSRGEHIVETSKSMSEAGSSPLARGTRGRSIAAPPSSRLIPARAGNTTPGTASLSSYRAHPRSRGEHERVFLRSAVRLGSSPLARGTRRD